MEKSEITEFLLRYFEENGIDKEWISEKTGIREEKLSKGYKERLTAEEFLTLCVLLQIKPEEVMLIIKKKGTE